MKRRRLLETSATLFIGGVAGCGSFSGDRATPTRTPGPVPTDTSTATPEPWRVRKIGDTELPVPLSEMSRALPPDGLLAIEEPAFAEDWSGLALPYVEGGEERTIRPRLTDEEPVVGIEGESEPRAYPLRVLNWHEIVNDGLDGQPLLVTYCPVCGSGMAAIRTVRGEETVFGVTGLLWKENLVMYDELTRSIWSQVAATAIHGDEWGRRLQLVPTSLSSWGEWRADHPDTRVLLPPPLSRTVHADLIEQYSIDVTRDYTKDPYAAFRAADDGVEGVHPLALVVGVATDDVAVAYPLSSVPADGVVNDVVGDRPVVVASFGSGTLVAYSRVIDGEPRTFERVNDELMRAAGTTWEVSTGKAVVGRYEGTRLERANTLEPLYLRSWKGFYPNTTVYEPSGRGQESPTPEE